MDAASGFHEDYHSDSPQPKPNFAGFGNWSESRSAITHGVTLQVRDRVAAINPNTGMVEKAKVTAVDGVNLTVQFKNDRSVARGVYAPSVLPLYRPAQAAQTFVGVGSR